MQADKDKATVQVGGGLIQVRLPIELSDKITTLARHEGITPGQWVARAVTILIG